MRIEILSDAEEDLVAGARFYERQGTGLGDYFLNSIYSESHEFNERYGAAVRRVRQEKAVAIKRNSGS
jgi:hypothetical protein